MPINKKCLALTDKIIAEKTLPATNKRSDELNNLMKNRTTLLAELNRHCDNLLKDIYGVPLNLPAIDINIDDIKAMDEMLLKPVDNPSTTATTKRPIDTTTCVEQEAVENTKNTHCLLLTTTIIQDIIDKRKEANRKRRLEKDAVLELHEEEDDGEYSM
jgi:hypothetical protein